MVRHSDKLYLDAVATKSGDSSIAVALKFRPREVCGGNNRRISVAKVGALVDEVCEARFVPVSLEGGWLTAEVADVKHSVA